MKNTKKWGRLLIFILIIIVLCLFYAFKIEPYRLKTTEIQLSKESHHEGTFKIVQFSDVHIKEDFTGEHLSKVVDAINQVSAEFVIFTGDLYDNYSIYQEDEQVLKALSRIEASVAKIAIRGNRDYGGGAVRAYERLIQDSGFILLTNESSVFTIEEGIDVLFTGLDDALLGRPYMPEVITQDAAYSIFLAHEPDIIENYPIHNYDLILSGHTHGGQIDIPFLPFINDYALKKTALASKYDSGLTALPIQNEPMLYINTGIGTTRISARFMVVPEITVFSVSLIN